MSDRLTNQWTKTTVEAFGDTAAVRKGVLAEQMYNDYANRVYDQVQYHDDDKEKQIAGFDFSIKKNSWARFYGVDVKGNMKKDGSFFVENGPDGWLRKKSKKNDRIVHICVETGWAIEYDRRMMIEYLNQNGYVSDSVWLSTFDFKDKTIARKFKVN